MVFRPRARTGYWQTAGNIRPPKGSQCVCVHKPAPGALLRTGSHVISNSVFYSPYLRVIANDWSRIGTRFQIIVILLVPPLHFSRVFFRWSSFDISSVANSQQEQTPTSGTVPHRIHMSEVVIHLVYFNPTPRPPQGRRSTLVPAPPPSMVSQAGNASVYCRQLFRK